LHPLKTASFLFAAIKTPLKYDYFAVGGCQFQDRPGSQGSGLLRPTQQADPAAFELAMT